MTAKEPYSSVLERGYDRFDAAHSAWVERSVARWFGRLDKSAQTSLIGRMQALPSIWVIALSFAFFGGLGMFLGEWTVTTLGYERKIAVLGFVFGVIAWFAFMIIITVRAIHRANARAAITGETQ